MVHSTRVLDRTELAPGVVLLGLHAPDLVRVTRPGHFVMVTPPLGASAAVALGVYEAEGDRASIMFVVAGSRTRELSGLTVGQDLDLFGPLGNGFTLPDEPKDVAIVAGGVGIASVLLPAQALVARGARVRLFYGARTKGLLVDEKKFQEAGCEVLTATDDASAGHHGFVTELLQSAPQAPELILACGPSPMLRAVAKVSRVMGVHAQLSLEETFACGVGACWGCVVAIDRDSAQAPKFPGDAPVYARICKEGPVFWAHELRW
ncbi:MAG: dihydroorotate dehydrogenase electron transfer subunit [Candidatus Baltobacteraceae bacterium]